MTFVTWKLKVKRGGRKVREMARLEEVFRSRERGTLQAPVQALDLVRGDPRATWPVLAVVGWYMDRYRKRFCREWKGGVPVVAQLYTDITCLTLKWDVETTVDAIEAVFSDAMKWVKGDHLGFMFNDSNMTRFVIPAVDVVKAARRGKGEQAEWSGARKAEGYEEVSL
jgi:hypothetical protein